MVRDLVDRFLQRQCVLFHFYFQLNRNQTLDLILRHDTEILKAKSSP